MGHLVLPHGLFSLRHHRHRLGGIDRGATAQRDDTVVPTLAISCQGRGYGIRGGVRHTIGECAVGHSAIAELRLDSTRITAFHHERVGHQQWSGQAQLRQCGDQLAAGTGTDPENAGKIDIGNHCLYCAEHWGG